MILVPVLESNWNLMKFSNRSRSTKQDSIITIDKFDRGSNNLVDEARMDTRFAVQSLNMMQVQDGLWKTRWGTGYYGADFGANPDGASEYVKSDGTTELITIAGGKAWKSTDGGAKTEITGATFTAGTQVYFIQIGAYDSSNVYYNYLYITNGIDALARYNGTTLEKYTAINAPTNLSASLTASGLTSGVYTYYAQVTALNAVGETTGSTEASRTTNKIRDNWSPLTDKVVWSWTASAGAKRYQIYLSDQSGYEKWLGSTELTNFTDDGSVELNPYVEPPDDNTTGAPKFISMALSGNRMWATNDTNNKYRVYFSGTAKQMGVFSESYGGGWVNLERGGREMPLAVKHYQSGAGVGTATVLCKTPDGRGAVWQISLATATVGESSFSIPSATKVVGSFGTESVLGVVNTNNDIAFPNRKGWFYLGPEKNYQGILRTSEKSSIIRPYWRSLSGAAMSKVCAYFYDAKIFISVPTSSTGNDRIVILDTERDNWSVDWSFGAKQFLEYTDTLGNTKLLYIPTSGTKLCEISENLLGDFGGAFNQSYISPLIPISKNKTDVLNLRQAIVELGRPKGAVQFQVLGIGKDDTFATLATKTITSFGSSTGVGADLASDFMPSSTRTSVSGGSGAWATYLLEAPSTFAQSTTKKAIKMRKKIYSLQFKVSSNTADTQYTILSLQAKGSLIQRKLPSLWESD